MKIVWAFVACVVIVPSLARGAIVYETAGFVTSSDEQNLDDPIAGNSFLSYGDEVTLGGTARQVTSISIPFELVDIPGVPGAQALSNYTPNLTLTLYNDNSAGPVTSASDTIDNGDPALGGITPPGTVIASSNLIGPTFVPNPTTWDEQTLTFTFNNVVVPNTFSFAVTQNNTTPGNGTDISSIDLFSIDISDEGGVGGIAMPQIVGTHNGFVWVQNASNSQFEATNYGYTNGGPQYAGVQAMITAVPEPSTWILAIAALAGWIALAGIKRTRAAA